MDVALGTDWEINARLEQDYEERLSWISDVEEMNGGERRRDSAESEHEHASERQYYLAGMKPKGTVWSVSWRPSWMITNSYVS